MAHNTIFFEKIMCCDRKIRWQIHATILQELEYGLSIGDKFGDIA